MHVLSWWFGRQFPSMLGKPFVLSYSYKHLNVGLLKRQKALSAPLPIADQPRPLTSVIVEPLSDLDKTLAGFDDGFNASPP